ncbi:putative flavoprotein involved in K+ transport [Virgibacillus campisalis]|uniref:Flavoprotein involved in K+ transport n=1 Tax=Virgibacillus alimentarius TaxID=698769 RepID=A0ABS4SB77_9BACI|nr:putative flavoprotein involved in K+ transport [Virgibacillus alimentarius]
MGNIYDVIIIGAGQAGIAMSYQLKQKGINNCLMIDAQKRIGDSWRFRYKSLVLFTPKSYSALPGLEMKGDSNSYPTKDEMADYLEGYVAYFNLPNKMDTVVTSIEKRNNYFSVFTSEEKYQSKKVIVASGAFQKPYVPHVIKNEGNVVSHMHSSLYTEPKDLNNGTSLVVGGGNSGAQIAVELSKDREVILAISHKLKFLPLEIFRKSIFYWLEKLQLLYAGTDTIRGRLFQKRNDPIFGKELKQAIESRKVKIRPRVTEVDGKRVTFSGGSSLEVSQIIWATGFVPLYEIIRIDGAIDKKGNPIHNRGISPINGLYYIGLPWQHSRGSALICGVGRDAVFLADKLF